MQVATVSVVDRAEDLSQAGSEHSRDGENSLTAAARRVAFAGGALQVSCARLCNARHLAPAQRRATRGDSEALPTRRPSRKIRT